MDFESGTLLGGSFDQGDLIRCIRTRGGYTQGKGFFLVHWEVQENSPTIVRLHVESPKKDLDPVLNGLKRQLIEALLAIKSDIECTATRHGYSFRTGRDLSKIESNKSTEVFQIRPGRISPTTTGARIELVNDFLAPLVEPVIATFRPRIQAQFV